MAIESKRSMRSAQVKMRKMMIDVAQATSAISGFDAKQIKSITKNGAGDWTIILLKPFNVSNSNLPRAMVMPMAAGVTAHLSASAFDRVSVVLSADVDFTIEITGCDNRFNY
jgi:hypothetical protein